MSEKSAGDPERKVESRQFSSGKRREPLIEHIDDPSDPKLLGVQTLMEKTFDPSEVDSFLTMQVAVAEKTYIVVAATDLETGEVIGLASGAVLPKLNKDGTAHPREVFFCDCYIAVDADHRSRRIGQRLYEKRMEIAARQAVEQGKALSGSLAEASEFEKFFNAAGANRLYIKTDEKTFEEVPYYQPPVLFDDEGNGVKNDGELILKFEKHDAPEHLVYAKVGNAGELTREGLMQVVRGMFDYNSIQNLDEKSDAARERASQVVREYEEDLEKFLDQAVDQKLYALSARERNELKGNDTSVAFREHHQD
jgi:GNAT superfamily N-acetyltransferase